MFTYLWPEIPDNGLSVVAVDDATDKVAGCFTGMDEAVFANRLLTNISFLRWFYRNSHYLNPMMKIEENINAPLEMEHRKLVKEKKEKKIGYKADCFTVAVHPDYGRRGIAANLTDCLIEAAKRGGFKVAYA